ncbi:uncharacterized protein B0I36DRAFT_325253 [Microdochium trichocladiopsis]|uniref:Histone H1 n=1 Tax=Microdochium trichocladiopsis TaxID=1682393 RepID=A0A9P9BPF9_9PEZI|nr:uncharacterized protein B0I36DRAFT_325253 [Microdochium trichocladiopsis]KAH7029202.1 hypothetical protein B0I36DRAFT_325253 [Microdochium trichocladiopsis]
MPPKKTEGAASKPKASHASYQDMITDAIVALKERNGSSRQQLKKYVRANNTITVSDNMFDSLFNKALKAGVDKGTFEQPKGPSGGTKLSKKKKEDTAKAAKKEAAPKPAKKEAAPKKAAPKKVAAAKKETTEKKPAAKKAAAPKKETKAAAPKKAAAKKEAPADKPLKKTATGRVSKAKAPAAKKAAAPKKAAATKKEKAPKKEAKAEAA